MSNTKKTPGPEGLPLWEVFANEVNAAPQMPIERAEPPRAMSEHPAKLSTGQRASWLLGTITSPAKLMSPAPGIEFPGQYAGKAHTVEVWNMDGRTVYLLTDAAGTVLAGRSRPAAQ